MTLKRSPFKRKLPSYIKAERIAPVHARLTIKVNMAHITNEVIAIAKENAIYSEPYRRLVATRPCINCGIEGYSQAAHPPPTAKGRKEDDRLTFALCCIHPGADGQLVLGCHTDFDQYRLVPKADMRSVAGHWAIETRAEIRQSGQWPKGLPHMEEQLALELAS